MAHPVLLLNKVVMAADLLGVGTGLTTIAKINRFTPSATGFPTNASHLLAGAVGSTGFSASTSIEERAIADFFRLFTKSRAQDSRLCRFIASTLKVK